MHPPPSPAVPPLPHPQYLQVGGLQLRVLFESILQQARRLEHGCRQRRTPAAGGVGSSGAGGAGRAGRARCSMAWGCCRTTRARDVAPPGWAGGVQARARSPAGPPPARPSLTRKRVEKLQEGSSRLSIRRRTWAWRRQQATRGGPQVRPARRDGQTPCSSGGQAVGQRDAASAGLLRQACWNPSIQLVGHLQPHPTTPLQSRRPPAPQTPPAAHP